MRKLCFLLVLTLAGCGKDELALPANVQVKLFLDRNTDGGGDMSFTDGFIDIASIEFAGDRESGEDITFVSDFQTVVRANLANGNTDPVIAFDIPQGTYNKITLGLNPDNTEPDIVVNGVFVPALLAPEIPVHIEINIPGHLTVSAKSTDGEARIVVSKNRSPTLNIFLNPAAWFATIPVTALQTAELQVLNGVPSIVISRNFNSDMYLKLANAIEASAEAVFQ